MAEEEQQRVIDVTVEEEMKSSYIDYAMSVIAGRALPDARDGLKPVHRRILFGMHELGVTHDRPHKKSARIVGDVLGKYHPHGDVAVYDTLVRMAQDFSYRYPLIDGQGNFGSIDGDAPAAMRYTEARLSKIAEELLTDIDKDTVDWVPNFDNTLKEPQVLPAKLPNLLINGSSGIAVGMATNMPPHNLSEVVDGIIKVIDEPEVSIDELMQIIKAPDFPTGGIILGHKGVRDAYETGKGSIKVRAKTEIETRGKRQSIVITEIPYQVNKSKLVEEIAEFAKKFKVESISGLRDESDRNGLRVVVDVKTGANASILLNKLYKHTQLETTFGVINLALVDGVPKVLTLKELIRCYIEHRREVTRRRLRYELERAEKRKHILDGLIIAISHIEEVVQLIKSSSDTKTAKEALITRFGLSELQAKEILEMRLSRLSALESEKIEHERNELESKIQWLKEVLASEARILEVIKTELKELKDKYGDARRTKIEVTSKVLSDRDFVEEEKVILFFTARNYVKRITANVFKRQRRGGKGIAVIEKKDGDRIANFICASTRERILLFTRYGRVYRVNVYEIPPSSRHAKGKTLVNIPGLNMDSTGDEEFVAALTIPEDVDNALKQGEEFHIILATARGVVKRISLASLRSIRTTGIVAARIDQEDSLVDAVLVDNRSRTGIILGSRGGKAILFHDDELREMGRYASGVRGMRLEAGDGLADMEVVDLSKKTAKVVIISERGYGKRTRLEEFRETHRGGKGVISMRVNDKTGKVVCIKQVEDTDELMLTTSDGMVMKMLARNIPVQGRHSHGVRLMNVNEGARVVAAYVV